MCKEVSVTHSLARPAEQPLRVLVVDDCTDTTLSLEILFRLWGHDVRTANRGDVGLSLAKTYRPHVALLDIALPGMCGYEIAQRLRAMPELKDALLVAISGYGREEDQQRAQTAGFNAHFIKPMPLDELETLLRARKQEIQHHASREVDPVAHGS